MPEKKSPYLPIIFVILAVVLGVVLRSFWLDYVIHPVANMLWFGWQKIRSVEQLHYWIAVITLFSLAGLFIFMPRKKQKLRSAYEFEYLPPGRFEYWQELFTEAQAENAGRERLREALIQLIAKVNGSRVSAGDYELTRSSPSFDHLSDAARAFLFPPPDRTQPIAAVTSKVSRIFKRSHQAEQLAVDEILSWIEKELEINYETE